jgi:hypothetical protein
MLEKVLTEINTRLGTLGIFSKIHGLCEIITESGISFPAEYCNNEYKQVSDFDRNGVVYHRINGNVSVSQDDEESPTGCGIYSTRTYPLKMVCCVKKSVYKDNDAFVEQKIAENIQAIIEDVDNKELLQELNADQVRVSVTSINTLRDSVFSSEYKGRDMFIKYEYAYLSIDYNIIIAGELSCYQAQGC